jgi:hypothetical protein
VKRVSTARNTRGRLLLVGASTDSLVKKLSLSAKQISFTSTIGA